MERGRLWGARAIGVVFLCVFCCAATASYASPAHKISEECSEGHSNTAKCRRQAHSAALLERKKERGKSGDMFFRNCKEAKAAGFSSIKRGSPGYRPALDRDHDGVACESQK